MHMCVQVHTPMGRLEEVVECPTPSVSTSLPWDGLSLNPGLANSTKLAASKLQQASCLQPPQCWGYRCSRGHIQFYMSAKDSNSSLLSLHTLPTEPSSLHQACVTFISYQVLITFRWEMSKREAEVDLLFLSKMQENCPGGWCRIFSNMYTYIFCLIRNLVTVEL